MNKSSATIMAAALMLASSCTDIKQEGQGYEPIIGKQEITIKDGRLTPEALWAMGRIGSLSVSPDGKKIAYTVAYYSVPENKKPPCDLCNGCRWTKQHPAYPNILERRRAPMDKRGNQDCISVQ